jgi:nucleotide-binding universal stress UspA family protein
MKTVYAVDLQHDAARDTVAEAAEWAGHFGATLDLLFVDGYEQAAHLIRDAEVYQVVVSQWAGVQRAHRAELEALLASVPEAVRGRALYRDGTPRDVIQRLATDYDLVMVATHGRTGLDHVFMGSTAEWLIRHLDVPVMVLRLPEATPAAPAS